MGASPAEVSDWLKRLPKQRRKSGLDACEHVSVEDSEADNPVCRHCWMRLCGGCWERPCPIKKEQWDCLPIESKVHKLQTTGKLGGDWQANVVLKCAKPVFERLYPEGGLPSRASP